MGGTVEFAGGDTGNGLDFGSQTAPLNAVILGGTISGSGNSDIQWDGTDLDTQIDYDASIYNNRDYESRYEWQPKDGTYNLTGDGAVSTIGVAAILSGLDGSTYDHDYRNSTGSLTVTGYPGGMGILISVRRSAYASVSITSGGENLSTEASANFAAFENFYMRLHSLDVTADSLVVSLDTGTALNVISIAPRITGGWRVWLSKTKDWLRKEIEERRKLYGDLYRKGAVAI